MEEASTAKKKLEARGKGGSRGGTERQENKHVASIIRKLDKETLNLYSRVRAGLGARETELDRPDLERVKAGTKS
jgi:hypothetical protein